VSAREITISYDSHALVRLKEQRTGEWIFVARAPSLRGHVTCHDPDDSHPGGVIRQRWERAQPRRAPKPSIGVGFVTFGDSLVDGAVTNTFDGPAASQTKPLFLGSFVCPLDHDSINGFKGRTTPRGPHLNIPAGNWDVLACRAWLLSPFASHNGTVQTGPVNESVYTIMDSTASPWMLLRARLTPRSAQGA